MAATLVFDPEAFRLAFPAFADETKYPDDTLQLYWDEGTCYISDKDCGRLRGGCRQQALNLMVAHLATLSAMIAIGNNPGVITSSGIDKISVGIMPPPVRSQFQYWLSTTPYGSRLWALLNARSVGGFYVGGLPEKSAFRKVAGIF